MHENFVPFRLKPLVAALHAVYDRIGELDVIPASDGGRTLPRDSKAADLCSEAARLAQTLAADLRLDELAFRPDPAETGRNPGGAS
jgi:hypothetical protein